MSYEIITLHVERSDDGETEFARVADILDALALYYAWEPNVRAYLEGLVKSARQLDQNYANHLEEPS